MNISAAYTLCFVKRGDALLMLNRNAWPNMGLWNGLGGKVEPGETPAQSVVREVREEAGISLVDVRFAGILTWIHEQRSSDIHLFLAELPEDFPYPAVRETAEGILAWKPIAWVLHPRNLGVVSNIPRFLPELLAGKQPCRFLCRYEGETMVEYTVSALEARMTEMTK
ncbi:8-oxo-dGTP diphosphatase [Brevibacillus sp. SYP-B805]|uniref:NUDIX hydrolase n=1 Tax=Brevibacillus sp. SYP-B805 TaxID=1578199 RepID=UPI0013EE094A|nr:8-oxo-dGTP diphosphatase [Brevibacillus sp. SYP-B805]NGQ95168.1 8-oxo-dGTP diphosphatase [Brevibacillus sp. SYP-B805]